MGKQVRSHALLEGVKTRINLLEVNVCMYQGSENDVYVGFNFRNSSSGNY